MTLPDENRQQGDDHWADIRSRYADIYQSPEQGGRWASIKDRLAILAVILVLALLGFLIMDGWVENYRCTFAEFVTFECNRWAGEEHPSLRQ